MAQPGKRKPSLVWDFFEKLDDGSGKCVSGGIFFCGISGGIFFFAVFLAVFLRYFWYFYNTGTVQKRRYLMFQIQNTGTALKLAIPQCNCQVKNTVNTMGDYNKLQQY